MNNTQNTAEYENDTYSDVQEDVVDLPEDDESHEADYADDGQDDIVDHQEDLDDEEEGDVGEDAEDDASDPVGAVQEPPKQTRKENAAIRAARLRAEREGYTRAEEKLNADLAKSGITNPYTGKPITTLAELSEYSASVKRSELEERSKKEGKPISVLEEEEANREFMTKMRKEHEAKNKPSDGDFIASDVLDFVEKHPEFADGEKLIELENNKSFRTFCGSRYGREPLSELYDSYRDFVGKTGDSAVARSKSHAARSTGAGGDGGDMLTPSERKALNEWNEAFPEMKMTPKEFKSRK